MREDTNTVLRNQLLTVRERYISALTLGDAALVEFDHYWTTLITQVTHGIETRSLQDDVVRLAHKSATFIASCGNCIVACEQSAASMIAETRDALAHLTLDPLSKEARSHSSFRVTPPPPYVPAAYEWLAENIHNPYPTSDVKSTLACRSGLSTRDIHEWFRGARRSIGWVDICKKHFRGSRTLAVEAVTRILLNKRASDSIPLEVEVDILSLQGTVECLFPIHQTLPQHDTINSDGVTFLPTACTNMTIQSIPSCLGEGQKQPNQQDDTLRPAPVLKTPANTETIQTDLSAHVDDVVFQIKTYPPPWTSRKRRLSDAGLEETRKRSRCQPGQPRRKIVSDPLPCPPVPYNGELDDFWSTLFSPAPTVVVDVDASRSMTVVPSNPSPPVPDEDVSSLSSFLASLRPENEQTSLFKPEDAISSMNNTLPLPFTDLQSSNEVLPFSDLSLMIDPVSPSQNLESFFSPSSHDLFDLSAGLLDASSDTSSILTLSPPSTPAISLSPGPSASVASLPEIKDCFDHSGCLDLLSDFRSSEVSFVSDDIFREVNEKDPLILDTESFPFFDPSLSMFSLNTNFPNISSLPVP